MADPSSGSILNIGDLAQPATVLIEKISDAIGGCLKPWQLQRVAQAESEAERLRAITRLEISELEERALSRMISEQSQKQRNMEAIAAGALDLLDASSDPASVENDWIANFFDRCRLISDEEMQAVWSRVLAGEANSPGKYSKRTISLLHSLDKHDATIFGRLCDFTWLIDDDPTPLVFNFDDGLYHSHGITFGALRHLDEIGLVTVADFGGYATETDGTVRIQHHETVLDVTIPNPAEGLSTGLVLFSKAGKELADICTKNAVPGLVQHVSDIWIARGYAISPVVEQSA